jgi:hypothetical protein
MKMFKKQENEEIRRLKVDPAACESLKGQMTEYGDCLVDAVETPDNPDVLVLKKMKYKGLPRKDQPPQE